MADTLCRSCGEAVPPTATTCPHCGVTDPIAATTGPAPAPGATPAAGTVPGASPVAGPPPGATPTAGAAPAVPGPADRTPPPEPGAGSRLKSAGKAIGCFVLALIVLAIALVVGVFDMFF